MVSMAGRGSRVRGVGRVVYTEGRGSRVGGAVEWEA